MTVSDGTAEVQRRLEERLEQARSWIRILSVTLSIMLGIIGGLVAGIVARLLEASSGGAVGVGGGAFIARATLALVVEARINKA
jgi:hypothetical protein